MDWSTTALMNNSPLGRRLPGQRTPPDPTIGQANAADLTYGWHSATSSSEGEGSSADSEGRVATGSMTRQQEAAQALRQRRRERRATMRREMLSDTDSSSEGSIASYNSAVGGADPEEEYNEGSGSRSRDAVPPIRPPAPGMDAESFICRICFDGTGSQDEGGETLGKLIAPCRCRGTMKVSRGAETSKRQPKLNSDQCPSVRTSSMPY